MTGDREIGRSACGRGERAKRVEPQRAGGGAPRALKDDGRTGEREIGRTGDRGLELESRDVSAHYDVAIVGAGPAGSWAAYRLARGGARVALLDASHPRE